MPENRPQIPTLRFPEFSGEWEEIQFEKIYSFKVTNSLSREYLNYDIGTVKNIHYGDIHTKFRTHFDITKEHVPFINLSVNVVKISEDNYCKEGDIIFADASEDLKDVGKAIEIVCLNENKLLSGLHTILARPQIDKIFTGFGGYLFQSGKVRTQIQKESQGSKVLSISAKRLANIKLVIPSLPEQQKIATFLTAIDAKIELLTKQKTLLEEYKKGVMQAIFADDADATERRSDGATERRIKIKGGKVTKKIRFKKDDGSHFPDWEERSLGAISKNVAYGMNSAAIPFDGINKYIRITDIDEESGTFSPSPLTSPDGKLEEKYRLKEGDIVFARTGASVGKSYLYNKKDGDLYFAGFLIKFSIVNENPYFIFWQTTTSVYAKWVQMMSMRSGQPGINAEEYKSFVFHLPSVPEQSKIAGFLNKLDERINIISSKIEFTKAYKKGLLNQLFA